MWFGLAFGFVVVRLGLGLASAAFCPQDVLGHHGADHASRAGVHSVRPAAFR
jgi:hypothetical protein